MKKHHIYIIVLIILLSFNSCKKGENDPFLSLLSRDARITGTWELEEFETVESIYSTDDYYQQNRTTVTTFDGTIASNTTTYENSSNINSYSFAQEIVIDKNGNFFSANTEDGYFIETSGKWWWKDSNKDKQGIEFSLFFFDYDIENANFVIDKLSSDEMILTIYYTDNTNNEDYIIERTYSGTFIYEKQSN